MSQSVVVVTGASSGIGKATAIAFAERGCAGLVVAARRRAALEDTADQCRELGTPTVVVPTDVTDEKAMTELAATAVERFGCIDTWVNNAGVTVWGKLLDIPMEDFRRVVETDLFGYVYGARAALRHFREQGSGVLINNAAMAAVVGEPYVGAYVAAKHAVHGLGKTLRQELLLDRLRHVHVCTVLPAMIDTPFLEHSANYTGREPKPLPPLYPPERVARAIVRMAHHPRRTTYVGNAGRLMAWRQLVSPGMTERRLATLVDRRHLYRNRPAPVTTGSLYAPAPFGTRVDGGWHGRRKVRTRRLLAIGAAVAVIAFMASANRRRVT